MPHDDTPAVFTLVWPAVLEHYYRHLTPGMPAPGLLVFRRQADGRVTAAGFPEEADVCEAVVAGMPAGIVRLERGRLYVTVANGEAVYVPVGASPLPRCTRYGRLYLRRLDA
jgi:hypothetical protein